MKDEIFIQTTIWTAYPFSNGHILLFERMKTFKILFFV